MVLLAHCGYHDRSFVYAPALFVILVAGFWSPRSNCCIAMVRGWPEEPYMSSKTPSSSLRPVVAAMVLCNCAQAQRGCLRHRMVSAMVKAFFSWFQSSNEGDLKYCNGQNWQTMGVGRYEGCPAGRRPNAPELVATARARRLIF